MKQMLPFCPIDVAAWQEDEEWGSYPEGARPKIAYFPSGDKVPDYVNSNRRYLFKMSDKRYYDQFWGEIVAFHIGRLMNVEVPPAYPSLNSANGKCGALIEWFYEDKKSLFVLGGNFLQQLIPGFDRKKGTQHNFHSIRVICKALQKKSILNDRWLEDFVKMLVFDAICGNTDRHQDNWGFVSEIVEKTAIFKISPFYDNGTSLGYELSKKHWMNWSDENWQRYIDRGRHHMRWSLGEEREHHVEFIRRVSGLAPQLVRDVVQTHVASFDLAALRGSLDLLALIPLPVKLEPWRADLMFNLVRLRRDLLLEALL